MRQHIHPIHDRLLQRADREQFLNQRSYALWLTGLSGSGKSTIAPHLDRRLYNEGFFAQVLDGDNIRSGINSDLGFGVADRAENIRRIAEIARLYTNSGIITINSFISPTIASRQMAKDIIGASNFLEVFINTPLEICEARDVKGLYKKARAGQIKQFTGIDAPYEAPIQPDLEVKTAEQTIEESVAVIYDYLLPIITPKTN